ncbi:hypothetical protein, partial [Pseudomonas helleri]|uniref:hypothetical protein n=1 Tax=Pseudomonas helleri TaxID=1608996 RepID=UPI001E61B712
AEFGIRHRAAPYRKGQVLHSVFAAAQDKKRTPPQTDIQCSQFWLSTAPLKRVLVIITSELVTHGAGIRPLTLHAGKR